LQLGLLRLRQIDGPLAFGLLFETWLGLLHLSQIVQLD
jgi:hypothetical protein